MPPDNPAQITQGTLERRYNSRSASFNYGTSLPVGSDYLRRSSLLHYPGGPGHEVRQLREIPIPDRGVHAVRAMALPQHFAQAVVATLIQDAQTLSEVADLIPGRIDYYNRDRRHSSLAQISPWTVLARALNQNGHGKRRSARKPNTQTRRSIDYERLQPLNSNTAVLTYRSHASLARGPSQTL